MSNFQVKEDGEGPIKQVVDGPNAVVDFEQLDAQVTEDVLGNEDDGEKLLGMEPRKEEAKTPLSKDDAITAIAGAMLKFMEGQEKREQQAESIRQKSFNEIDPVSPWNPTGKRVRLAFKRGTFLHGIALNAFQHTEEDIALCNQLKPGRYLDRRVEVQKNSMGEINIQWAGKKLDNRMQMYGEFPTFTAMLKAIIAEREFKEQRRRAGLDDEDDVL